MMQLAAAAADDPPTRRATAAATTTTTPPYDTEKLDTDDIVPIPAWRAHILSAQPRRSPALLALATAALVALQLGALALLWPSLRQLLLPPMPASHPSVLHPPLVASLDPAFLPTEAHAHRRLIMVGDVHGCAAELAHLLRKVDFDRQKDHLVLAGDMLNKGPHSARVLRMARQLGASAVRGNHEDNLLRSGAAPASLRLPKSSPARLAPDKSEGLRALAESLVDEDWEWLVRLPVMLALGHVEPLGGAGNATVVHAGLVPGRALGAQKMQDVMHMRTMSAEGVPSEERDGGCAPWFEVWGDKQRKLPRKERMVVVYGHDSKMGVQEHEYSVGLDSGCVKGGRLTALVVGSRTKELVSVGCGEYFD